MNDLANLYVALKVTGASVGSTFFRIEFDNEHGSGGPGSAGDDAVSLTNSGFDDWFFQPGQPLSRDSAYGGSEDGVGLDADRAGFSFYELSHPLDTADNAHDFSLRPGMRVGFEVYFLHCVPDFSGCAQSTRVRSGDIVAVSGSRIPPDTQLTIGPREGSWTKTLTPTFEFSGSDDVLQPSQLTFECRLDEDSWGACTSPHRPGVDDGRHTFSVRASDEMLNVDPSPSDRHWIVDTTNPSKPAIHGRRGVRAGQAVVLRFSATDELTPARQMRFKCSVTRRACARARRSSVLGCALVVTRSASGRSIAWVT